MAISVRTFEELCDDLDHWLGHRGNLQLFSDIRCGRSVLVPIDGIFTKTWKVQRVALIGHSFGADALPAAYNQLPPAERIASP